VAIGCTSKAGPVSVDAQNTVDGKAADAPASDCGNPGDVGNELGIGKYCASLTDCLGSTTASLCSSLGDPNTHFCTKRCTQGSTTECGTGAACTCDGSNRCGCTPMSCLN